MTYSAKEVAEFLKLSKGYKSGEKIRLIACEAGRKEDGVAQQLANELGVSVLAPTEKIWVNQDGEFFISDSDTLAEIWYNGEKVKGTGTWKTFTPKGSDE